MEKLVMLTPKAVEKAKAFSEKKKGYVSFGLRKAGCSGFMYEIGFAPQVEEGDSLVEQDGAKVIVSSSAKEFLKGSTIDFQDSLMSAGFKINNPNVKRACKCGHSIR